MLISSRLCDFIYYSRMPYLLFNLAIRPSSPPSVVGSRTETEYNIRDYWCLKKKGEVLCEPSTVQIEPGGDEKETDPFDRRSVLHEQQNECEDRLLYSILTREKETAAEMNFGGRTKETVAGSVPVGDQEAPQERRKQGRGRRRLARKKGLAGKKKEDRSRTARNKIVATTNQPERSTEKE
ncbi:hypothetical protein E3N88_45538 [Mikania micrantha]|uniref:Uncharacterized protein n=1 Tax=Mikania micrantha TaxID=192012 RepID=A0A5N6L8Z7_9ASTR|nr:hypothetical protein E3N88_45538 [Mikania micrantha]